MKPKTFTKLTAMVLTLAFLLTVIPVAGLIQKINKEPVHSEKNELMSLTIIDQDFKFTQAYTISEAQSAISTALANGNDGTGGSKRSKANFAIEPMADLKIISVNEIPD